MTNPTEPVSFKPLKGVKVLDLSRVVAGPFVGMVLADLGAIVLKVESKKEQDPARTWGPPYAASQGVKDCAPHFAMVNRGKTLAALDFSDPADKQVLLALIGQADVLVENFKPGSLDRLGLGHEPLLEANPKLIWCSVTGYGGIGPYAHRAGYDAIAQAASGFMGLSGTPESGPMKTAAPVVDQTTGMWGVVGVLAALLERARTGKGRRVEVNLLATAVGLVGPFNIAAAKGEPLGPQSNGNPFISPFGCFRCADGQFLMLTVGSDAQFQVFAGAIGLSVATALEFERHGYRKTQRKALEAQVQEALLSRSAHEWEGLLGPIGIACSVVNTVQQAHRHPQVQALGLLRDCEGVPQVATPVFVDGVALCADTAPPLRTSALGPEQVLAELLDAS